MCVQGELPLCVLPSDGSTTDKENMRSVICVSTSIYLVYVRISGKGITVFFTSIYLMDVRIPGTRSTVFFTSIYLVCVRISGKGITAFLTSIHLMYVRILGRGSPCVAAPPNLSYIVRFGPYRPHGFVPGDASPHLSLTSQNAFDKLAISTLNKANYQSLTRRCGTWQYYNNPNKR